MIRLNFLMITSAVIPVWLGIRIKQSILKKGHFDSRREFLMNLFFVYLLSVIYLTMNPFLFNIPFLERGKTLYHFDFHLFYELRHMRDRKLILLYSVGNILMFVPFGFFLPLLFRSTRKCISTVLMGFTCSLTIEITQTFFTMTRRGTADDLFFNTLGAGIGYSFYRILKMAFIKFKTSNKIKYISR